jgi:uncharacterized protein (DUF427 family)
MLTPGRLHPITIEPAQERVTVRVGGAVVADTTSALRLREARYQPVYYVPLADVNQALLKRSATTTYCPYKGNAAYYSIVTPDTEVADAIWTYETPYSAVEAIASHVAFYPDRVEITTDSD